MRAIVSKARVGSVLVAVLVVAGLGLAACGSSANTTSTSSGSAQKATFTWACSGLLPPFSFVQNGKLQGFDVAIGNALAQKMGMTPHPLTNPFETLINGLTASKFDAIISTLSITPERQQVVNFSTPYIKSDVQIYVSADNTTVNGPSDLKGKKIGCQKASTYIPLAQKATGNPKDVVSYSSDIYALQDLVEGRTDAVITDNVTGALAIKKGLAIKPVGAPFTSSYEAIAVRKDDPALLKKINVALAEIMKDGTYKALCLKWVGQVLMPGVN